MDMYMYVFLHAQDYKPEWDPSKFHSVKADRGPLTPDWKEKTQPLMCCYKLVTCEFKWFGLQGTVESRIQKVNDINFLVDRVFEIPVCMLLAGHTGP